MSQTNALTAHNLSKSFQLKQLFQQVTFSINAGERLGLIGPNGSGKTTLLRLLTGELMPDNGHISHTPSNLRIGYLPQGFALPAKQTLSNLIHQTVGDPAQLEAELIKVSMALGKHPQDETLQMRYDQILTQLSQGADGANLEQILSAFGLANINQTQHVGTLSGGQKTRLALALLLLSKPQILLLDEPTNHLDAEMLAWLEQWLLMFEGGVLMVSHDRLFLDHTATHILDLDPHKQTVQQYTGNYSDYLEQYTLEQAKQWQTFHDQVYEIRRMKQDIARTKEQARQTEITTKPNQPHVRRLAKKVATKAKSREKKLDRYLASDERIDKPSRSWQMKLNLETNGYIGKEVLRLEQLSVGYERPLLQNLTLDIQMGERVILTGANGSGKTTLLRTITKQLPPLAGQYKLGHSVKLGVMTQEQTLLNPEQNAVETIQQVAPMTHTEIRSFLHFFLFKDDEPLKPNHLLSFGQRARLALAKLVAEGCNFLVLDEPINHLDIPSREQFEQALSQFNGTVFAVVHDRMFTQRFASTIWQVHAGTIQKQLC